MRVLAAIGIATVFSVSGCVNATRVALDGNSSSSGGSGGGSASISDAGSSCGASDRSDFDSAFAAYRSSNGLSVLSRNGSLEKAASTHTADIAPRATVSHVGSNGSRLPDRVKASGYGSGAMHENIGQVRGGASDVLAQWDASPGHKAGLVGNFRNYGISCMAGADGYNYWTLVLAS